MSKAFTKDSDHDDDEPERSEDFSGATKNYVTPFGFQQMQNEMRQLMSGERPKLLETIRWAAGNGDRSENGDYIYGKKRLREIYRRVRYLTKRLESAEIIDPERQKNLTKVFFGATVTYQSSDGQHHTVKLVGVDEANLEDKKISWISPLAQALLKAEVGDSVKHRTADGIEVLEIIAIEYEVVPLG